MTVFKLLMEYQRTEFIHIKYYERFENQIGQRNEKELLASTLGMYILGVPTRKASHIVEEIYGKSFCKSFIFSLTTQLDSIVKKWQNQTS